MNAEEFEVALEEAREGIVSHDNRASLPLHEALMRIAQSPAVMHDRLVLEARMIRERELANP